MSNEIKTEAAPTARASSKEPAAAASKDLSQAIEGSVQRGPGEEVRSVRVYDDNYRCNWWVRDAAAGPIYLNTGRIIRSKFLKVRMEGDKLIVQDISSGNVSS